MGYSGKTLQNLANTTTSVEFLTKGMDSYQRKYQDVRSCRGHENGQLSDPHSNFNIFVFLKVRCLSLLATFYSDFILHRFFVQYPNAPQILFVNKACLCAMIIVIVDNASGSQSRPVFNV